MKNILVEHETRTYNWNRQESRAKMLPPNKRSDAVHWYMNGITSAIVADSGIPTDIYHLGKIILYALKSDPDLILHIDGATGVSETFGAALKRTVQCARAFNEIGLQRGDVIVLMAPNHLDLAIPFYAALYLGIAIEPLHQGHSISELENTFKTTEPKVVFCQNNKVSDIKQVFINLRVDAKIVTFDKGDENFEDFLKKYGKEQTVDDFKAADFDPADTIACLVSTSGSTGLPKKVAITHKNLAISGPNYWSRSTTFPTPTKMVLVTAPMQWVTTLASYILNPYMKYPRLQTSLPCTLEHLRSLINTYKPSCTVISTTMMTSLLKCQNGDTCDLSCFTELSIGGSAVDKDLIAELKRIIPHAVVQDIYGLSETAMTVFDSNIVTPGSCGQQMNYYEYKLVDAEGNEIHEAHVPGELWLKSPGLFKGYYKDPEATKEAFCGEWFKTGDMFYRDENWYYYFFERIKSLLKYKGFQVSPVEIEVVIRQHPGVQDVAVTGVDDPECGDLPVSVVVPKKGHNVTAQEIKDLVKGTLTDAKQLRGGVVFLEALPVTKTTKIDRRKLKELVLQMKRE